MDAKQSIKSDNIATAQGMTVLSAHVLTTSNYQEESTILAETSLYDTMDVDKSL